MELEKVCLSGLFPSHLIVMALVMIIYNFVFFCPVKVGSVP